MSNDIVLVVGLGEVGRPLLQVLSRTYECTGVDLEPVEVRRPCSVLHICYGFQVPDFIATTVSYIKKYEPRLAIIHSTIATGTTRVIQQRASTPVAYSPVRGKHAKMEQELLHYRKFVAGLDPQTTKQAEEHLAKAGFQTATFRTPEIGELSKLVETTWLGVLVGWAQEIERMAVECGGSYEDVNAFIQEIAYLPTHVFPGHIGGHCVMPNIAILQSQFSSGILQAVVESNRRKGQESDVLIQTKQSKL